MKFLLLIFGLMLLAFVSGLRKGRSQGRGPASNPERPPPPAAPAPQLMVRCLECGTHLPQAEALPGRGGLFCCAQHRAAHEARQQHG